MNQKLLEALRRGNERDALQALELHPNSLFAWLDGEPLLHSAVRQGMLELARTLLEAGAEVDEGVPGGVEFEDHVPARWSWPISSEVLQTC